MGGTISGFVVIGLSVAYLAWFVLLIVRRATAAELRSKPLRERIGELVIGVLAVPVLTLVAGLRGAQLVWAPAVATGVALALWTFAPRYVGAKFVPVLLVCVGLNGLLLTGEYAHGLMWSVRYGLADPGYGSTRAELAMAQAYAFLAAGLWLTWRRMEPGSLASRLLLAEPAAVAGQRGRARWELLLLGVFGMAVELLGRTSWFYATSWHMAMTVAMGVAALVLVFRFPAVAADLALVGIALAGLYGIALAAFWPFHVPLPADFTFDVHYGAVWVSNRMTAMLAGAQGLALLGIEFWLLPRALDQRTRALLRSAADAELGVRVVRLTRTRADAADTATAELRRLERDLHDGAQARLVALGMSLRAAERLIPGSPEAAVALVAEARESSLKVLSELRDLVRGICPPVLADRGLADAVRALALDTPLCIETDIDLPGRPELPVESACYFAVAEALANAVKHSGARQVEVGMRHDDGKLRITVIDDGTGGADPRRGSGLVGMERRLATFDGVLAVNSPMGGPTIVAIEVPCALSSLKTSSC